MTGSLANSDAPSPLTGGGSRRLERIRTAWIVAQYESRFGVDVRPFFRDTPRVELWECLDTSLGFFLPADAAGDSTFYSSLARLDWYHARDRWEHRVAAEQLPTGARVLEIGCGSGAFLERVRERGCHGIGLERQESAVAACERKGLKAELADIPSYAARSAERYDAICAFQVLEHLEAPRRSLDACVRLLAPGGLLLLSVPNHDSFVGHDPTNVLNMPPHHLTRWNARSLRSLSGLLGLESVALSWEPLQEEHRGQFVQVLGRLGNPRRSLVGRLIWRLARSQARRAVGRLSEGILGHTILAVLRKPAPEGAQ